MSKTYEDLEAENQMLIAEVASQRTRIAGVTQFCSEAAAEKIAELESENASLREKLRWVPVSEAILEDGALYALSRTDFLYIEELGRWDAPAEHLNVGDGAKYVSRSHYHFVMRLPEPPKEGK